jgi:hypothetical protein
MGERVRRPWMLDVVMLLFLGALFVAKFMSDSPAQLTCSSASDVALNVAAIGFVFLWAVSLRAKHVFRNLTRQQAWAEWLTVGAIFVALLLIFSPRVLRRCLASGFWIGAVDRYAEERMWFWIGLSILLLVIIVTGLIFGLRALRDGTSDVVVALTARQWPTTSGVIEQSNVVEDQNDDTLLHTPTVRYSYEVAGTHYTGTTVVPGQGSTNAASIAQRTVDRYPVGKQVQVYYQPADPHKIMLEPRIAWGALVTTIVGAAILLLLAAVFVTAIR